MTQVENLIFIEVSWVFSGYGEAWTDRAACDNLYVPGRLGPGRDWGCKERGLHLVGRLPYWGWRGQFHLRVWGTREDSLWAGGLGVMPRVGTMPAEQLHQVCFPISPNPNASRSVPRSFYGNSVFVKWILVLCLPVLCFLRCFYHFCLVLNCVSTNFSFNLYLFSFNKLSLFLS